MFTGRRRYNLCGPVGGRVSEAGQAVRGGKCPSTGAGTGVQEGRFSGGYRLPTPDGQYNNINSNDCSQKQFLTNGQRFSKAKQINYSVKSMNIRRKIL